MPLTEGAALLHPEAALLKWADTERCIDLGQICYLRRNTSHRKRFSHTFDETSFDSGRVEIVRNMVEHLSNVQRLAIFRPYTIQTRTRHLLGFINWVDMQGLTCDLSEQKSMEAVYVKYVKVLRELVSQNQLNKNSVANMQRNICVTLAGFFNTETFAADVLQMQNSKKHVESTPVPDQMSQAALLGVWAPEGFKQAQIGS